MTIVERREERGKWRQKFRGFLRVLCVSLANSAVKRSKDFTRKGHRGIAEDAKKSLKLRLELETSKPSLYTSGL